MSHQFDHIPLCGNWQWVKNRSWRNVVLESPHTYKPFFTKTECIHRAAYRMMRLYKLNIRTIGEFYNLLRHIANGCGFNQFWRLTFEGHPSMESRFFILHKSKTDFHRHDFIRVAKEDIAFACFSRRTMLERLENMKRARKKRMDAAWKDIFQTEHELKLIRKSIRAAEKAIRERKKS